MSAAITASRTATAVGALVLVVVAVLTLVSGQPPNPLPASAPVQEFSAERADFTELAKAGLPGMNFAYIQGAARYHTPGDTIANLNPASLQHHGTNMLALTRALGNRDLATLAADHDATYFRVLGSVISYPIALVRPLALIAVVPAAAASTRPGRAGQRRAGLAGVARCAHRGAYARDVPPVHAARAGLRSG